MSLGIKIINKHWLEMFHEYNLRNTWMVMKCGLLFWKLSFVIWLSKVVSCTGRKQRKFFFLRITRCFEIYQAVCSPPFLSRACYLGVARARHGTAVVCWFWNDGAFGTSFVIRFGVTDSFSRNFLFLSKRLSRPLIVIRTGEIMRHVHIYNPY